MKKFVFLILTFVIIFPAFTQTSQDKQIVIALINFLGTQAALIQKYQEDSPTLEDIYNRIENDTQPALFGSETTRIQIRNLFNNITNFQNFDIRRDRIRAIRESAKARAISQSIPSPVFFLSLANNIQNPLALVVNIAGMAAQSITSYMSATEQADLTAYTEFSKLTEAQKSAVNNLRTYMYDYMSRTAREFNLIEDYDTISRVAITEFVDNITNPNLSLKLNFLLQRQVTYQNYYPYWLDLANTYFELKRYNDCLATIERYEAIRVHIFRPNCDYDYANTLSKGIIALSNVYSGDEYKQRCIAFLKKIEANTPFNEWSFRYASALAYIDLASKSALEERQALLNSAYKLLKGNMNYLITNEQGLVKKYIEPLLEPPKDASTQTKRAYERARDARKTELPPFNYALYANFYALYGVMEQLNVPESEWQELTEMTEEVFLIPDFRMRYLKEEAGLAYYNYYYYSYDDKINISITRPFFGNNKLNLTLPVHFFLKDSFLDIEIYRNDEDNIKTQVLKIDKVFPVIKKVNRPSFDSYLGNNENYLSNYKVDMECDLGRRISFDKKNRYLVSISVENSGTMATMRFRNNYNSLEYVQWEYNGLYNKNIFGFHKNNENKRLLAYTDLFAYTEISGIKWLTDKLNPDCIIVSEKYTMDKGIFVEIEKYMFSEKYRSNPRNNGYFSHKDAIEYHDNQKDDSMATLIEYVKILDYLNSEVNDEKNEMIGIMLNRSNDEKTANIIIVHPDDKVEFRYYEK